MVSPGCVPALMASTYAALTNDNALPLTSWIIITPCCAVYCIGEGLLQCRHATPEVKHMWGVPEIARALHGSMRSSWLSVG